jgi:hypothetical protein
MTLQRLLPALTIANVNFPEVFNGSLKPEENDA